LRPFVDVPFLQTKQTAGSAADALVLASVAQPLALVEMTPSGDVVATIPLPTATDAATGALRCTLGYSNNYWYPRLHCN
jgi:hypothetical protein